MPSAIDEPDDVRAHAASEAVASIDDIYQQLGGHILWSGLKETETVLKKSGVGFAMLENELLCTELISQYLSVKRRQVL